MGRGTLSHVGNPFSRDCAKPWPHGIGSPFPCLLLWSLLTNKTKFLGLVFSDIFLYSSRMNGRISWARQYFSKNCQNRCYLNFLWKYLRRCVLPPWWPFLPQSTVGEACPGQRFLISCSACFSPPWISIILFRVLTGQASRNWMWLTAFFRETLRYFKTILIF